MKFNKFTKIIRLTANTLYLASFALLSNQSATAASNSKYVNAKDIKPNLANYCLTHAPSSIYSGNVHNQIITQSKTFSLNAKNSKFIYEGDVKTSYKDNQVRADRIEGYQNADKDNIISIEGKFDLYSPQMNVKGSDAVLNASTGEGQINDLDYQIIGSLSRGVADKLNIGKDEISFQNATYTSCLPNELGWTLKARKIYRNNDSTDIHFVNVVFYTGKIPVFYLPYLRTPYSDTPVSGILAPNIRLSSRKGIGIRTPYYWRIKDNLDLTYTPTFYTKDSIASNIELRYLNKIIGLTTITLENASSKLSFGKNKKQVSTLLNYKLQKSLDNVSISLNHTGVNNRNHFKNVESTFGGEDINYILNTYSFSYNKDRLRSSINFYKYLTVGNNYINTYSATPDINVSYMQPMRYWSPIWSIYGQFTKFTNIDSLYTDTLRLNINPQLFYTGINNKVTYEAKTKLYTSFYRQTNQFKSSLNNSVSRFVPEFSYKVTSKLYSDRAILNRYYGIISPSVSYVFRPNFDKGVIYNKKFAGYDTSYLPLVQINGSDFNNYSGSDFIGAANYISTNLSYSLIDVTTGQEKFMINFDKRHFFSTKGYLDETKNINAINYTSVNGYFSFNNLAAIKSSIGLNKDYKLNFAASTFDFKLSNDQLIQLNHIYANKNFINNHSNTYDSKNNLNQVGASVIWNINNNTSVKVSQYIDVNNNTNLQREVKLAYSNCCWVAVAGYERNLVKVSTKIIQDNKLTFEFQLNGFGKSTFNNGFDKLVNSGRIRYTQ